MSENTELLTYGEAPEILEILAATPDLQTKADAMVITTDEANTQAKTFIVQITGHMKAAEESYRRFKDPIVKRGKELDVAYKTIVEPLKGLKTTLGNKAFAYEQEQARKARIEAERLEKLTAEEEARQQEALDAAERERVAAEEALQKANTDEEVAAAIEQVQKAEQNVEQAEVMDVQVPISTIQVPEKTTRTDQGSTTLRGVQKIIIVNADEVPRKYCVPSQPLLNAALKLGETNIPGTRVETVASTTTRVS